MAVGVSFAQDSSNDDVGVSRSTDHEVIVAQSESYSDEMLAGYNYPALPQAAESDPFAGSFEFSAGWLFLRPTVDNTYFVIESVASTPFPNGTRLNDEFGYESAFRVGAAYKFRETNRVFQVNYTRLDSDASKTVAGDFLWASAGRADFTSAFENYAGTASSSLEVSYDRLEVSFSQPWPVYRDNIFFRYGLEYANIDFSQRNVFTSSVTTGTVSREAQAIGVGPEFGIGIDHSLGPLDRWTPGGGKLSMNMWTTASLLIGQSNGHASNMLGDVPLLDVFDDNASRLIPALHARLRLELQHRDRALPNNVYDRLRVPQLPAGTIARRIPRRRGRRTRDDRIRQLRRPGLRLLGERAFLISRTPRAVIRRVSPLRDGTCAVSGG